MHYFVFCGNTMIFKLLLSYFEDTKAQHTVLKLEPVKLEEKLKFEPKVLNWLHYATFSLSLFFASSTLPQLPRPLH